MFSVEEKKFLAAEVEKLLLGLKHPEMPTEKPVFKLHVKGKDSWSWADVLPNWEFSDATRVPNRNPWNEHAREIMELNKVLPPAEGNGK